MIFYNSISPWNVLYNEMLINAMEKFCINNLTTVCDEVLSQKHALGKKMHWQNGRIQQTALYILG